MLYEENRLENWYKGITKISYPYQDNGLKFHVSTSATAGSFKTQYFDEKFDVDKIESFDILIEIFTPKHIVKDPKFFLNLEIERLFFENQNDFMKIRTLSGDTSEVSSLKYFDHKIGTKS